MNNKKLSRLLEPNLQLYFLCLLAFTLAAVTVNPPLAAVEDAAQQTWLQLAQNWERVSALPWKETEGYTVTVAKNCALDILRAERRTTAFPEDWDPPAREDRQEEYDYLVSLIRALPENYRRILELKFVEEQTNREIARRLGLSESAVGVRVMRGRAMLKERLEKEGYTYEAV